MVWIAENGDIVSEAPKATVIRERPTQNGPSASSQGYAAASPSPKPTQSGTPVPATTRPTELTDQPLVTLWGLPLYSMHIMCMLASSVVFGIWGFLLAVVAWFVLSKKFAAGAAGARSASRINASSGNEDGAAFLRHLMQQQGPPPRDRDNAASPPAPADPWSSKGKAYKLT